MLRRVASLLLVSQLLILGGCASSKLTSTPMPAGPAPVVKVIAFAPAGGLMSDAVGVELSGRGFTVIDGNAMTGMLAQMNLTETDVAKVDGLVKLKSKGIDAYLVVHAVGGYDQSPQSASARLISTESGAVLVGVNWQNGFGGSPGSIADRLQRDGLTDAAKQIAAAITERVTH